MPEPLTVPQLFPLGSDAIIVRFSLVPEPDANIAAQSFCRAVEAADLPGLVEIVPSLASAMVLFDRGRVARAQVLAGLERILSGSDWKQASLPAATRRWVIPAVFGGIYGPQLVEAATCAGLSEAQALADLSTTSLHVLAIGFAPGQPYLGLLPAQWNIPRMSALTPLVPEGALVVALRQVVLFANPSVTGWRHVGQCAFRLFRPESSEPFPLRLGDEVRFERVAASEFATIQAGEAAGAHVARCEVLG